MTGSNSATPEAASVPVAAVQPIAVVRGYDSLRAAIADWCVVARITRAELDARVGLADGHSGKLLSTRAVSKFGNRTLGPVLQATGLAILIVQDDEALALIEQQLNATADACDLNAPPRRKHWRTNKNSKWGRRMSARRTLALTPHRRREIARKAAQARWQRRSRPKPQEA
jgi:hypothetical protein